MTRRFGTLILVVATVFGVPIGASAQTGWDAISFEQLLQEAELMRQHADELSGVDRDAYHRYLYDAASIQQQAMEMLGRALLTAEVGDDVQSAKERFVTLSEERIAVLLELQQCVAARIVLEQALYDPNILPEQGVEQLTALNSSIDLCGVRVFDSPVGWDEARFEEYLAESDLRDAELELIPENNEQQRESLLFEVAQLKQQALSLLQTAMHLRRVQPEQFDELSARLATLYLDIFPLLIELDLCDATEGHLARALENSDLLPEESTTEIEALNPSLQRCPLDEELVDTTDPNGESELVEPVQDGENLLPYILLGSAAATGLSALIIDISYADERDALSTHQDDCAAGPCNRENADSLAETIDTGKIVIASLAGVAIVTGVTGLILLLTDSDSSDDAPIEVDAGIDQNGVGASLRVRF